MHCTSRIANGLLEDWNGGERKKRNPKDSSKKLHRYPVAERAESLPFAQILVAKLVPRSVNLHSPDRNQTELSIQAKGILSTVNLALSSPEIPSSSLALSKIYLYLLPATTTSPRERIVGCVLAQRITTAFQVIAENQHGDTPNAIHVDGNVYCRSV